MGSGRRLLEQAHEAVGVRYGSGATRIPFTALQIAALAPMETARVRVAVAANPGDRRRSRIA